MKYAFALVFAFGFATSAAAEVYNIPGSTLTLKQMSDNYMTGTNFRSQYTAPINYTGVGKFCSVTMAAAKHAGNNRLNLSLFKHTATEGNSIDAQPTLMANVKSRSGDISRKVQLYKAHTVLNPDVDSSKDFLFVVVYNAYSTKVMGITVEILPECPPN